MVSHDILAPAHRVALAYAPVHLRSAWTALLALDVRMAGIVRSVREPMLAQIRLAWWRDTLARPAGEWPDGEPLLRELAAHLPGEAQQLAELPSAWEHLLADGPIATIITGRNIDMTQHAAIMVGQDIRLGDVIVEGQSYGA